MLEIVICGGDLLSNERLNAIIGDFLLSNHFDYKINIYIDFKELYDIVEKGFRFHIVLIDIYMHETDGIGLSRQIRRFDANCIIIYISVSAEHAIVGYSVHAFDYIIKPFEKNRIVKTISEAVGQIGSVSRNEIAIRTKGATVRIKCSDIKYIESVKHYLRFYMANGEQYRVYGKLDEYESALKIHNTYMRCHQSFLINMNYVKNVSGRDFIMCDDAKVPIRRSSAAKLKREYYKYSIENSI